MIPLVWEWLIALGAPELFRFFTVRGIGAAVSSFLISLLVGRPIINALYSRGYRSVERSYGDIDPSSKRGTPVMGGVLILVSALGSSLLWCDLRNPFVLLLFAASGWFAAMGAFDDMMKIRGRNPDSGLSRVGKFAGQIVFAVVLGVIVLHPSFSPFPAGVGDELYLPFLKDFHPGLGWWYLPLIVLIIVYSANAVNFADGMDGLAIVPTFFLALVLGVFGYVLGNATYSGYLLFPFIPGSGEVAVFCGAVAGAAVGFLWFNAHPAEVFMGDMGSLFLGGVLGTAAVLVKQEVLFVMAGGIFVAEILSTWIQETIGFKRLGARVFYRAPIHHTFQHRGMAETKIVVRFWIVSGILAALAVATLKVR